MRIKKRNSTIDILRLIFAILIVALHSSPLMEISAKGSYIFTQVISRLSIPYFATIGGYFFFKIDDSKRYLNTYFVL